MSRAIHKMRGGGNILIVGSVLGNTNTSNSNPHALGNIDVGGSDSDKNIILGITWSDDFPKTVSSVTVGGVSLAEKVTALFNNGQNIAVAIWTGDISSLSGSQAISVTFPAGTQSSGVSGVVVTGLRSLTPDMTDTDSSSGAELTIAGLASQLGGIAFACGVGNDRESSITWGSITERSNVETDVFNADHRHSAAWDLGPRAAANATFGSASGNLAVVGAGFR